MAEQAATSGPLTGWKVVDLTRVLGGPYCTQLLGDLGAEVIKLEPPQGDETRDWGPPYKDGEAAYYMGTNRNKRSMALDVAKPEGREILLRLLEGADAMVENFKTGTLEKWGLGYAEVLSKRFPRLIHCRVTGFGADGPMGGLPGYDAVIQGMTGWFSVNGDPAAAKGLRVGIPLVDMGTALLASNAILAAAVERERSGKGQFVEATLFDTGIALMHPHAANWFLGRAPGRTGNAHSNIAPYDAFPTGTVDIYMAVGNNRQFQRLCQELGAPELPNDPRFTSNELRVKNRPALRDELIKLLKNHDGKTLAPKLIGEGVPAGPILDTQGILTHPHALHRKMVVEKDGYRGTGIPIKFSRTPGSVRARPPRFGQHSREILRQHGYGEAEIDALVAKGIVPTERRKMEG